MHQTEVHLVDDPADDERDVVRERHVAQAAGQQRQQRRAALHGLLRHVQPDVVLRP